MSALDQAFIKAYAKEPAGGQTVLPSPAPSSGVMQRAAVRKNSVPATPPHIENIYAEGTLYRIESPQANSPEPVPPPHFEPARLSRRQATRFRLRNLAGENLPANTLPSPPPARPAARRTALQRPAELPPPPISISEPPEAPVKPAEEAFPADVKPRSAAAATLPENPFPAKVETPVIELSLAPSALVCGMWDELTAGSSQTFTESAIVSWPVDLSASSPNAMVCVELETIPLPPPSENLDASASEKNFRLDAAHAAQPEPPHFQPGTATAKIELQPAAEKRPAAITAAEAAALQRRVTPQNEAAAKEVAPPAPRKDQKPSPRLPLVPSWEVDEFQWPTICERLMSEEQSYFSQAGVKLKAAVRDGLKVLAITGSRRGEGRTTLAMCLAQCAAKAGLHVALVDADFARPQIASTLSLEISAGWTDAALFKSPLAETAVKSLRDKITVLPLEVSSQPLSLADSRLVETLREVSAAFELTIVDQGPLPAGDEPIFPPGEASPADAAIVIRDLRYCTLSESQAIGDRLHAAGIEAVGIAENFVPQDKTSA